VITPIFIACGKRYVKCAAVAIETWLKYHFEIIYVVVDNEGQEILSKLFPHNHIALIPLKDYAELAKNDVGYHDFHSFEYDGDGEHSRLFSSLKPLIMDRVIADYAPDSKYVLSLDADVLFTGNILNRVREELDKVNHEFDLYMVERTDPRMLLVCDRSSGSGFTLWKRGSSFIKEFKSRYTKEFTGPRGGSQNLINLLLTIVPSHKFGDPFLHFVSPDEKNPDLTDEEIATIHPAYIHLHGRGSYERLKRFQRVFEEARENDEQEAEIA